MRTAAFLVSSSCALALACNSIVGVTDVRLRVDAGGTASEGGTDDTDGAIPDDGGVEPVVTGLLVSGGGAHTCAKLKDGPVRCWGDNSQGQLGSGADPGTTALSKTPVSVLQLTDGNRVCSGFKHACAVKKDGTVACWGFDLNGQLGDGKTGSRSTVPVALDLQGVSQIGCGSNFTCAVTQKGALSCWGGNLSGQLGNGTTGSGSAAPVATKITNAVSVSAGEKHACAVLTTGKLVCWGANDSGQLGSGSTAPQPEPAEVPGLSDVAEVAAGQAFTCVRTGARAVRCFGANNVGQLGNGSTSTTPTTSPVPVTGIADAISLGAGNEHACAARSTGKVACWGTNAKGQLGNNTPPPDGGTAPNPIAVTVTGVNDALTVGVGGQHACAGNAATAVYCWGANESGQVGNDSQATAYAGTPVKSL